MRHRTSFLTAIGLCLSASVAFAAIEYDQNVTNNVIYGSGNSNGGFTTDRNATLGIELGLRAHVRYPSPNDSPAGIKSQGNGTYGNFDAVAYSGNRASWNMDWSINSNYNGNGGNLSTYTYLLELDFDPGWGTNYQSAYGAPDPINGTVADHSFGDNSTAANSGVEAVSIANYATLVGSSNLVQNSSNLDFEDMPAYPFDPTVDGRYSFRLSAYDSGVLAAQTTIHVQVGNGVVPEATSLLIWGGIISCVGLIRRRRID